MKAGGGILLRRIDGRLTFGSAGLYLFNNLNAVMQDIPSAFSVGIDRQFPDRLPEYDRRYRHNQFFVYAEDSYKASQRLTLYYGVRYENFGAPVNVGSVKDYRLRFASGGVAELGKASVEFPPPVDERLYSGDANNWSGADRICLWPRHGFAYGGARRIRHLLRPAVRQSLANAAEQQREVDYFICPLG